ncbi:MAG: imidazole glycerol phosphate synthase subunit HisH [bacterium]
MIAIIDYGMGNLRSVQKGFEKAGFDARIVTDAKDIKDAAGLVLPGVGAFAAATKNLEAAGLTETIIAQIKSGKPFLGICLGFQMLFEYSEEGERIPGLGLYPGRVVRFTGDMKVPHMGWNQLSFRQKTAVVEGIPDLSFFYFVHSYYVEPADPALALSVTNYGIDFVSAIARDNVTAVQFHPEKSQKMGLRMLQNFGRLTEK